MDPPGLPHRLLSGKVAAAGWQAVTAGLCALLIACGSQVNQENYERVQSGMTEADVRRILGEPTETSSLGIGPVSGTTAVWRDRGGTISIQFLNGTVQVKNFSKPSG